MRVLEQPLLDLLCHFVGQVRDAFAQCPGLGEGAAAFAHRGSSRPKSACQVTSKRDLAVRGVHAGACRCGNVVRAPVLATIFWFGTGK
jgi:hypothetical protein